MSGRKQHFIPQSLLRGFGRKGKGDKIQVVAYTHDRGVFKAATDGIGAERNFYSELALEPGEDTLDDKITAYETPLADVLADFRGLSNGARADELKAAELVAHLVIRNDHFRKSVSSAAADMFAKFSGRLAQEDQARAIFGLAGNEPASRFQMVLEEQWNEHGSMFEALGWTKDQYKSFMFNTMRANFSSIFGEMRGPMAALFANIVGEIPTVAATAQRRSLNEGLAPTLRVAPLRSLTWRVHYPEHELTLPDCIAIGLNPAGDALPLNFAQDEKVDVVCMPLSSDRLLLGSKRSNNAVPALNEAFASCSWDFFVAAEMTDELEAMRVQLRSRVREFLEKTVDEAVAEAAHPERA